MKDKVISDLAYTCAHCGHIEPTENSRAEYERTFGKSGLVFVHKESCIVPQKENDLFWGVINCKTHIDMNDVSGRHNLRMIIDSIKPFIDEYLTCESYFINRTNKFW